MAENKYVRNKTIREAFEKLDAWEEDQLDIDSTVEIHYSEKYERYMARLLRAQKRPWWQYTNTVGKKVAVIALVILFAFGASMSVSAVRKPVVEFIVNVYERFVEIFFGEEDIAEAPCEMDTIYTLGKVPEGYELVESNLQNASVGFVWKDDVGNSIKFSQHIIDSKGTYDYENSNYIIVNVSGMKVAMIEKEDRKMFCWNSNEYAFLMRVPSDFSLEECAELIKFLSSIDDIDNGEK